MNLISTGRASMEIFKDHVNSSCHNPSGPRAKSERSRDSEVCAKTGLAGSRLRPRAESFSSGGRASCVENSLEPGVFPTDTFPMDNLAGYRRDAMKLALVTKLGGNEGYAARIPGFRGLIATGRTRKEATAELNDALADWIDLALRRGIGLPALRQPEKPTLTAA